MKKSVFPTLILILIMSITACNNLGNNINPQFAKKGSEIVTLDYLKDISFRLDSLTTNLFIASQYIPELNLYSFLSLNKNIMFYDYNSHKFLFKIPLNLAQPSSYQFINKDSILILDYSTEEIFIINDKSDIINSYKIQHNIKYYPSPITKIAPITYVNGNIYIFGNIAGEYNDENEENRRVLLNYNCKNNTKEYFIPYPEVYKNNWNGTLFRWCYADYNCKENFFFVSFPAEHYLYSYDLESKLLKKVYAGSKYIESTSYIKKRKSDFINADERTKHFVETNSYANILYDSFRDVYYRFAELKSSYEGIPGWTKEISIIILDSKFNKIGETLIGELPTTYRYSVFITKEGLHLPNPINEDALNFSIYKLSQVNYEKK